MFTVLVAGAGQLGSRHLQGVKKSHNKLDIWVYDLSTESLKIAEERYNQITSSTNKTIHYVTDIGQVPRLIDVAIIASSSIPRFAILSDLLKEHKLKYLILEKFLFTRLSEYVDAQELLTNKGVKTFVNCRRRMHESYLKIYEIINYDIPIYMEYRGKDWGLCCNSIHFIDIFMYLSNSKDFTINIDNLIQEVIDSKRNGYVELRGQIEIHTDNGSTLILSSTIDFDGDSFVFIKNGENEFVLNEGNGLVSINGEEHQTSVKYQSDLSGQLVDELLETGSCKLTPYPESSAYHQKFLSVIAPFINKLKNWTSDSCPIT